MHHPVSHGAHELGDVTPLVVPSIERKEVMAGGSYGFGEVNTIFGKMYAKNYNKLAINLAQKLSQSTLFYELGAWVRQIVSCAYKSLVHAGRHAGKTYQGVCRQYRRGSGQR